MNGIRINIASLAVTVFLCFCSVALQGCAGDSSRLVQETETYSFDDIAAQAAADSALSEEEENE